jgi:hypothetical protein
MVTDRRPGRNRPCGPALRTILLLFGQQDSHANTEEERSARRAFFGFLLFSVFSVFSVVQSLFFDQPPRRDAVDAAAERQKALDAGASDVFSCERLDV